MPCKQKVVVIVVVLNLIRSLFSLIYEDDDDDMFNEKNEYIGIGNVAAKDVYSELMGTPFFRQHANCNESMFHYIYNKMDPAISCPRNNKLRLSFEENALRKRRKCKIDNINRCLSFLHQIGEDPKVWDEACWNGWNISSTSRDFKHCLLNFINLFDCWIKPLSDAQKLEAQVYEYYPSAYSSLDGSMFRRRATHKLPPNISRRDYYDHKKKHPESLNVQAVATKSNYCTHLNTRIPGGMCDSNASRYIAKEEWNNSIIVDDGYPADRRFLKPDGSIEHKQERCHIEWLFGGNKMNSRMAGGVYRRSSKYHSMVVRSVFILGNMRKVFGSRDQNYRNN